MSTRSQARGAQWLAQCLVLTLVEYPAVLVAGEEQSLTGELTNSGDTRLTVVTWGHGFVHGRLWDTDGTTPVGGETEYWLAASAGVHRLAPGAALRIGGRIRACVSPPSRLPGQRPPPLAPLPPGTYQLQASTLLQATDDALGLAWDTALSDATVWWREGWLVSPFYRIQVAVAT
jgi:hypothetical protein